MPNDLPQTAAPETDADDKPNAYVGPAGKRESTPWNSRQRQNDFGSLYNSTPEPAYAPPEANRSVPAREATGGAGRLAVVLGITAAVVALIAAGISKLRKPDAAPTTAKTEVAPLTQPPAPAKAKVKPVPKPVEARVATPRPAPIREKPVHREEAAERPAPRHTETPKTIVKTVFVPAPAPKPVVSAAKPPPPKPAVVEHTAPKQSRPKESVEDRAKRLLESGGE